jgi:hypothetical protein
VIRGLQARNKVVEIAGLGEAEIQSRLQSRAPRTRTGVSEPLASVSGHPRSKAGS